MSSGPERRASLSPSKGREGRVCRPTPWAWRGGVGGRQCNSLRIASVFLAESEEEGKL